MTPTETSDLLLKHDNFLLITHRRPDGDTLGSAGALALALKAKGKNAYLLKNKDTTPRYEIFVNNLWAPNDFSPDFVVSIDTASLDLFPENALSYKERVDLCIDHHPSNSKYASFLCLESHQASCGEVIYDILLAMNADISNDIATCIYVAISTDTGCFSFANTTSRTLYVASKLVEAGTNNGELNKYLFRTKTQSCVKIGSKVISSMEYHFDGKVAIAFITNDMIEEVGASEDDLDDIASLPTTVEGVCIGITIRELTSQSGSKISVRSSEPYNANEICGHFGGGGHVRAAGATVKKTVQEVRDELLEVLKKQF